MRDDASIEDDRSGSNANIIQFPGSFDPTYEPGSDEDDSGWEAIEPVDDPSWMMKVTNVMPLDSARMRIRGTREATWSLDTEPLASAPAMVRQLWTDIVGTVDAISDVEWLLMILGGQILCRLKTARTFETGTLESLRWLLDNFSSPFTCVMLGWIRQETDPEILIELSRCRVTRVVGEVMANPNTPLDTVARLRQSRHDSGILTLDEMEVQDADEDIIAQFPGLMETGDITLEMEVRNLVLKILTDDLLTPTNAPVEWALGKDGEYQIAGHAREIVRCGKKIHAYASRVTELPDTSQFIELLLAAAAMLPLDQSDEDVLRAWPRVVGVLSEVASSSQTPSRPAS